MSQQEQQQLSNMSKLAELWQSYSQAIAAYTNQTPQSGPQSGTQAPNVNVASSPNSNAAAAAAVAAAQYYGTSGGASSSMLGTSGNNPSAAPPASNLPYAEFYAQMEKYYSACASYTQGQAAASYNSGSYTQQSSGSGSTHYSSGPLSQQNTGYSASTWRGRGGERGRSWGRGQRGSFGRGWRQYSDHWSPSSQNSAPPTGQDTLKANPEDVFDWWVAPATNSEPTIGPVGGHFSGRDDRGGHPRQHDVHRDDHRPHDVRKDDHHSDRYRNVREGDRSRWSPHGGKSPRARWEDDRTLRGGSSTNKTRSSLPEHPSHTPPKRIAESINFRSINPHMPANVESLVQQQIQLMMSPLLAKTAPPLPPRQFTVPPIIRDKQTEQPQSEPSHSTGGKDNLDSRGVKGDQKRDSTEAGLKATTERSSRSRSRSPVRSKLKDEEKEEAGGEGEKKVKQDREEADGEQKDAVGSEDTMDTANAKLNKPTILTEDVPCQSPESGNKDNKEQPVESGLEGYDSSKKYGEEYIREVTAFQCFLCGRRFWQQDEVEHHCRSQGHFTNYQIQQKCKLNLDEDEDDSNDK
ncbi:uncharacterized protein LOC110988566 [Acanthaster planci]|uniref:Uncharacterized protein LOC110988566 n=1 Tax=Acanthaster planci TaxID=133434 RepID=A0A8B7ZQR4_ACAPL|nr:uncharacterized protein LOC110988566 [Acanthaster planci]